MIKFFRKIRYDLLENNKIGKYLKYAVGEIVLVVIGIVIALQINNWNETRKQHKAEKEFITSVKNDLEQDSDFIQLIIKGIEPKMKAYETLNINLPNLYQKERNSLDSILDIYFKGQRTFYPISGSYQSAVSGNQLTTFGNKDLIHKVVKLYNSSYDRLIDNGQILDVRWDYLSKKYSYERRTGHFREMDAEQLTEFLDDLFYHYIQMKWYLNQLKLTTAEIDKILIE